MKIDQMGGKKIASTELANQQDRVVMFFWQLYGWVFVRPRRWFFLKMLVACHLRAKPERDWEGNIKLPNYHWHFLYRTVFKFFKWLNWDAWRPFCDWTGGFRRTYPLPARIIHRVGKTTAGFAAGGGECFHCASEKGDPVDLSQDETGATFTLEDSGARATADGTDYWFTGTTICPRCGYKQIYSASSL